MEIINKDTLRKICDNIYQELIRLQYKTGEFGKDCESEVAKENQHRHAQIKNDNICNIRVLRKPNCSISLIAALGIMSYKGINDVAVQKAYNWFSNSKYVSSGWFHQNLYQLDSDPFGSSSASVEVQDVRHTATALLGVLSLGSTNTFSTAAFINLTQENVFDSRLGGWVAVANINTVANKFDFYTTVYMLTNLKIINDQNLTTIYGIEPEKISLFINRGLNAICSTNINKLGYNDSLGQVLRANATMLFFCSNLMNERNNSFLKQSVAFLLDKKTEKPDGVNWNNDIQTTINVIAGLVKCIDYLPNEQFNTIINIIDSSLKFIMNHKNSLGYKHPASLGFLLCICTRMIHYCDLLDNSIDENLKNKINLQIAKCYEFIKQYPDRKEEIFSYISELQSILDKLSINTIESSNAAFNKIHSKIRYQLGDKFTVF